MANYAEIIEALNEKINLIIDDTTITVKAKLDRLNKILKKIEVKKSEVLSLPPGTTPKDTKSPSRISKKRYRSETPADDLAQVLGEAVEEGGLITESSKVATQIHDAILNLQKNQRLSSDSDSEIDSESESRDGSSDIESESNVNYGKTTPPSGIAYGTTTPPSGMDLGNGKGGFGGGSRSNRKSKSTNHKTKRNRN